MKYKARTFVREGDIVTKLWKRFVRRAKAGEIVKYIALETRQAGSLVKVLKT